MITSWKKCERPLTKLGIRLVATPYAAPLRLSLGGLGLLRLGLLGGGSSRGGLFLRLLLLGGLTLSTLRGGPEGQVVPQQLHDQGAVTVALLRERVELRNGVIESLLGQVACTIRRVEDLVVEDGEVQGETQTDGVSGGEVGLGNIGSVLFMHGQLLST